MSLTNPKDVITEERLSEFYQQILPYLGGMPEALANKFSKSDLYSTDEKIVGCWTNGKPLYQKTIQTTLPSGTTVGTMAMKNVPIGASVDFGYVVESFISSGGSNFSMLYMDNDKNGVTKATINNNNNSQNPNCVVLYASRWFDTTCYITIRYTKTTDAANSFKYGNETDYSTEEKIVGTWIDGKPLYQKTISCGALPNKTQKTVAHGISNLGSVVDIKGYTRYSGNNTNFALPLIYYNGTSASFVTCNATGTNIVLVASSDFSVYSETYVTIQYTKTTD